MDGKIVATAVAWLALSLMSPSRANDSATYTYDTYGRIWTVTYANGTVTTYTYDAGGNRSAVVTTCSSGKC